MSYTLSPTADSPPPPAGASSGTPAQAVFGNKDFDAQEMVTIRELLQKKLGNEHLAKRQGAAGSQVTYIEGWKTIELANRIFGFNGWSSTIVDLSPDFIEERGGKFIVGVTALVKITLKDGTSHEDVGYGLCENPRKGIALENAKKEAVTDARKRALRLFGNALGNCIYDKGHVKRINTTPTVGKEGFLSVEDPTNQVKQEGPPNKLQKTATGNAVVAIKKDPPTTNVIAIKPMSNASLPLQRQQPVAPVNYQPPAVSDKWQLNEGDMAALEQMAESF